MTSPPLGELQALACRLRQAAPRYTSYPTVPFWSAEPSDTGYREALATLAARPDDPVAVYVHLPFCLTRCSYCGCHAVVNHAPSALDRYLDHLALELEQVSGLAGGRRRVVQLHWGGGTPNYLSDAQLRRLAALLRGAFDLAPGAEVSVEVDPRAAHPGQPGLLRELGFNRVSLGVQDLDPGVQAAIGRHQAVEHTVRLLEECRAAGFASVNVDLVYGLPTQTSASVRRTLERVIELAPDRIAMFSYAHVPHLRPNQRAIDASALPGRDERLAMFHTAVERLTGAGYAWIGLDHFARSDDALAAAARGGRLQRTFMGYTVSAAPHLLAFGASGIGSVAGRFVQNETALKRYGERLAAGELAVVRGLRLDRDDQLRALVIEHLMCNLEIPWTVSLERFGGTVPQLLPAEVNQMETLQRDGLVELDAAGAWITPSGRYFLRNVATVFDRYREEESRPGTFSAAV
jgi:oxygen-independent coproporphyrinogen-3 oxidase